MGQQRQAEKITLHRLDYPGDPPSSSASKPLRPRANPRPVLHKPVSESWSEFPFPLCRVRVSLPKSTDLPDLSTGGLPLGLGPTDPCPSTVHMETYSASVFCVLKQNNRYYHQDLHWDYTIARRLTPNASTRAPRPPTRSWIMVFTSRPAYHR